MSGKGDGKNHDTGSGDGIFVGVASDFGTDLRANAPRSILGLFQAARTDADYCAGLGEAQRESTTFCSSTAYDCDICLHE
jgi:hypothetical protein